MRLEGSRIYLRNVERADVSERYLAWLNDPRVNRYLETRFVDQTRETIERFVREKINSRDEIFLAICLKPDGRHIGNIKLGPINTHHKFADISYFIGDPDQWGKGYASEAIRLVVDYAFHHLGLNKVTAGCYAGNQGSVQALQKAGFTIEGVLRKQLVCEGQYVDKICLGILNPHNPGSTPQTFGAGNTGTEQ